MTSEDHAPRDAAALRARPRYVGGEGRRRRRPEGWRRARRRRRRARGPAIDRVLLTGERVTSAAEGKRLLAGEADLEARTDRIQRAVVVAVPAVRVLARGARFTRVPWVMVASSVLSVGVAVRTGVRELQMLASLVAHRLEQATGAPAEPALVKKLAIDLYLEPKRAPDLADDRLRLVRLSRKWVLSGAFSRNTSKQAAKALDAAERLDAAVLTARWAAIRRADA